MTQDRDYAEATELTFDQVLGVLLSLLGHLVTVSVSAADGMPPLTLTAVGTFAQAIDIDAPGEGEDHETFLFTLGDPPPESTTPPSFFLHRHAFRNARVEDGVLWLQLGPLQLMIEEAI